jgi:demethylmenaquinone methyltransferase/2-methoxy-6-polyprenyl-1,4-benzoquinol methylase
MSAFAPPSESKGQFVCTLFAAIAQRYDFANHLLSVGLDFSWRRRTAAIVRDWQPLRILDLATGSGDLALMLRATCPSALVVGADFCRPMLRVAQGKGVPHLVTADALQLPFTDRCFDALTVAFGLRNMASWSVALSEMRRVLRPGGYLLVLDFSIPAPPLRWIYRPYLRYVLPQVAAWLTGEKAAYDYLGDSIEKFPQGAEMCALLGEAGFAQPICQPLSGGIVSLYTATRPVPLGD